MRKRHLAGALESFCLRAGNRIWMLIVGVPDGLNRLARVVGDNPFNSPRNFCD